MSRRRAEFSASPAGPAMADWVDGRHGRGEIGMHAYRASLRHAQLFGGFLGHAAVGEVEPEDCEDWVESLTVAPSSRNQYAGTPRAFWRWALRRGLVDRDPWASVGRVKVPDPVARRVPRRHVEMVLRSATFRERVMIVLLATTGLRLAELTDLTIEDFDRETSTLLVRSGKGGRGRRVPIEGEAADALRTWLSDGRLSGPMWPSVKRGYGQPLSYGRVRGLIIGASNRVGLHITPHQYRHTLASELMASGAPIEHIRRQLGHVDIGTTGRYLAADVEDLRPHVATQPRYFRGEWGFVEPDGEVVADFT